MSSVLVHRASLATLPAPTPAAWRADLVASLEAGRRILTLYGQRRSPARSGPLHPDAGSQQSQWSDPARGSEVVLTAVLQDDDGGLRFSRTSLGDDDVYVELTSQFPALQCFEREVHEQTGLPMPGHPWLKPLRYEGQEQSAMLRHPYYKIDGKEVHEVAVGPIHAGVIEPGSFRFSCLGERVHHLEIQLGYQHRGVERRLLQGDPRRQTPLIETVAGDTSVAWAWAWCAALERLAGCELAADVEAGRAVALELERVAMHLAGLSGLAADIGFLQGATTWGRLRTTAINTSMRLCGSRFGRGAVRPGGIGMKLPAELLAVVCANLDLLRNDIAIINEHFLKAHTVQHRLCGAGVLSVEQARALGVVGMAARSSGVGIDTRQGREQGAYAERPIGSSVLTDGDCWDRARLRILEIDASLKWLQATLDAHPRWESPRQSLQPLQPRSLVVSVVEGWRGEVVHCLETDDDGGLLHAKVQDPSLRNWMALAIAMRGNDISDFPICNKSFDLSYCGNDL
ncbi:MAG: hydrogenase [Deltaproteobacteria bacterium]|nr:hydrogenase [Deltaproteobacteria bacterium]